ncbi:unnamed protein product [Nezara viridula]|uniref:Uncharacterized protein n=1 Tax=Nezara viridula TaxID=85310 RepID=A0A9P0HB05_NEZVI|nr:unnamed protein product [Nezara viridula]
MDGSRWTGAFARVKPFRMTSTPAIYTILFYTACCCLSVKTTISLLTMYKDSQNYHHSLQILMLMPYLIQNFVIPITYWQKSGQILEYIALWSKFEVMESL